MDCEKALKQYFQPSVFDQILMLLDKKDEIGEYLLKKYWQSWVNNYYLSEIINIKFNGENGMWKHAHILLVRVTFD